MLLARVSFDEAPYRFSGTVYGTLLNHRAALAAIGPAANEPPYKGLPRSVVLYVKPRNTLVGPGEDMPVDDDAPELEVGASLGLVIGRVACRVREADALDHLAGYTIVHDVSVPHDSFYRPQIRLKAPRPIVFDGTPWVVARHARGRPAMALAIRVFVDGRLVHASRTADLIRSPARLLADVTDFMTLAPGDVLLTGVAPGAPAGPRRPAGRDRDRRSRPAREPFRGRVGGRAMKRARVAYGGALHEALPHPGADGREWLRLADGRVVAEDAVVWLPPFEAGTVIALGLNYADHAKELAFKAQEEPLVFLKGPGALIGHRGQTRRPADATFMHYECELAVVIGRPARSGQRAPRRWRHVAGYTVANDYAIRDYLENWYRPNLRVKNRDTCTVLGPWLVDAGRRRRPAEAGAAHPRQRQRRCSGATRATWSSTSRT